MRRSKRTYERANQTTKTSRAPKSAVSQRPLPTLPVVRSSPCDVDLVVKYCYGREERPGTLSERKRLFLRVGDEVSHLRYEQWGIGVVVEVMTSSVPGGTCLARVRFQDGQLRCFNNDLDNEACCYYFGVRRYWNPTRGVDALRAKFLALKG